MLFFWLFSLKNWREKNLAKITSNHPIAALSLIIFAHFLNHFYAYIFGASLFIIRTDIIMNNREIGLLATIQMAIFSLFTFAIGIIGDKWKHSKRLFVPVGVFIMGVQLIIAAYAKTYNILILVAVIVGFGASFYHPVAYASIADLYENKKGITMALNAALGMIGTALTPGLIASFSEWIGWRNFFLYFGIGAVLIASLLYYGFVKLIIDDENENNGHDSTNANNNVKPWIKPELMWVLISALIICLVYATVRSGLYKIVTQFLSIIFVDYYGYNIFSAGWLSSIMLIIGGLTAIFGGMLSDRHETSLTMLISSVGSAITILLIFLLGGKLTGIWIVIIFFIFVAFLHFSSAASTKYVSEAVPVKSRSTALGFLFAIPSIIAGVFPWLFGFLLDTKTVSEGFILLFILSSAASLLSLILLIIDILRRKKWQ